MPRAKSAKVISIIDRAPLLAKVEKEPPVSNDPAAWSMWCFYRDNKALLITDIADYRESILIQIQQGIPVEQAFSPYHAPVVRVRRRA